MSRADELAHTICSRLLTYRFYAKPCASVDDIVASFDSSTLARDIYPLLIDYERLLAQESVESTCKNSSKERTASSRKRGRKTT